MLERILDWYRKLSWFVIGGAILMLGNTEFGFPPDKVARPKPPIWKSRLTYLGIFALGTPGTVWSIVRASRGQQRTPWGDRE